MNGGWGISYEIALRWMPLDLTDDKSPLVQVMVWCCQATSHYLSQCWPKSMSPNVVTRPQWVNTANGYQHCMCHFIEWFNYVDCIAWIIFHSLQACGPFGGQWTWLSLGHHYLLPNHGYENNADLLGKISHKTIFYGCPLKVQICSLNIILYLTLTINNYLLFVLPLWCRDQWV